MVYTRWRPCLCWHYILLLPNTDHNQQVVDYVRGCATTNRKVNKEWTMQEHRQQWVQDTQNEEKQNTKK
jgi:hypothetical protein